VNILSANVDHQSLLREGDAAVPCSLIGPLSVPFSADQAALTFNAFASVEAKNNMHRLYAVLKRVRPECTDAVDKNGGNLFQGKLDARKIKGTSIAARKQVSKFMREKTTAKIQDLIALFKSAKDVAISNKNLMPDGIYPLTSNSIRENTYTTTFTVHDPSWIVYIEATLVSFTNLPTYGKISLEAEINGEIIKDEAMIPKLATTEFTILFPISLHKGNLTHSYKTKAVITTYLTSSGEAITAPNDIWQFAGFRSQLHATNDVRLIVRDKEINQNDYIMSHL
jgi:hypothetical protein